MLAIGDLELCVETFGSPQDPTILLIMGAAASMLHWDDAFCRDLADTGRHVVRYDHRDTGRSTAWPPGSAAYSLRDLVKDAVGVLDALQVARAHVVGMSMGAAIGQLMALDHPDRVASLTLLASTPGGPGHDADDLPGMTDELAAALLEGPREGEAEAATEPGDPVSELVDGERPFAGTLPFDEPRWRSVAERSIARARSIASAENHYAIDPGPPWRHRLPSVLAPTLVLHGTADPMLPLAHGEALAREISGARLLTLAGAGHEPPPRALSALVIDAIATHTQGEHGHDEPAA